MSRRPIVFVASSVVLLLVLLAAHARAAEPGSAPASGAPASSAPEAPKEPAPWLPPTPPADAPRLQQRLYSKQHSLYFDLSGQYLSRADFYNNPALAGTLSYYFYENWAIDVAYTQFFSTLQAAAQEVQSHYNLVPDAHQPYWLVRSGLRFTAGYGKVLIAHHVIHLEPQVLGRLGVLSGDASYDFGIDLGLGLLIHWTQLFHSQLEVSFFPHFEKRSGGYTPIMGVIPSLSFGVGWSL